MPSATSKRNDGTKANSAKSPWKLSNAEVTVALSPREYRNGGKAALVVAKRKAWDSLFMKYLPSLKGVPVALRGDIKSEDKGQLRLRGASPFAHCRLSASVLLFAPSPGCILTGRVMHVSMDSVAINVLGTFHANVKLSEFIPGYQPYRINGVHEWRSNEQSDVMNDKSWVRFCVIAVNPAEKDGLMHMDGSVRKRNNPKLVDAQLGFVASLKTPDVDPASQCPTPLGRTTPHPPALSVPKPLPIAEADLNHAAMADAAFNDDLAHLLQDDDYSAPIPSDAASHVKSKNKKSKPETNNSPTGPLQAEVPNNVRDNLDVIPVTASGSVDKKAVDSNGVKVKKTKKKRRMTEGANAVGEGVVNQKKGELKNKKRRKEGGDDFEDSVNPRKKQRRRKNEADIDAERDMEPKMNHFAVDSEQEQVKSQSEDPGDAREEDTLKSKKNKKQRKSQLGGDVKREVEEDTNQSVFDTEPVKEEEIDVDLVQVKEEENHVDVDSGLMEEDGKIFDVDSKQPEPQDEDAGVGLGREAAGNGLELKETKEELRSIIPDGDVEMDTVKPKKKKKKKQRMSEDGEAVERDMKAEMSQADAHLEREKVRSENTGNVTGPKEMENELRTAAVHNDVEKKAVKVRKKKKKKRRDSEVGGDERGVKVETDEVATVESGDAANLHEPNNKNAANEVPSTTVGDDAEVNVVRPKKKKKKRRKSEADADMERDVNVEIKPVEVERENGRKPNETGTSTVNDDVGRDVVKAKKKKVKRRNTVSGGDFPQAVEVEKKAEQGEAGETSKQKRRKKRRASLGGAVEEADKSRKKKRRKTVAGETQ